MKQIMRLQQGSIRTCVQSGTEKWNELSVHSFKKALSYDSGIIEAFSPATINLLKHYAEPILETREFYRHINTSVQKPITSIPLDDVFAEFMQDPEFSGMLNESNKKLAKAFYNEEQSLRSLRLASGLTQSQLADAMETSQAQIAKLENGLSDFRKSTVQKLATIFQIEPGKMFNILSGAINGS